MKFSVKIIIGQGGKTQVAYLRHRDRTAWSKRTAKKFAVQYTRANEGSAIVEPAESYEG